MTQPKTLTDAIKFFAVPENCRDYMVARRWPDGVTCPVCGSKSVYFDTSRNGWECKTRHPKRKFTLKTGTVFEDSPLGLDKWLPAVWMIANMKNGVSSHELARSLGVTQKSAWFMLHRIRLAMHDETPTWEPGGKMSGHVEADETFIGGKARNMHPAKRERIFKSHKRGTHGKIAVMGLLERNSPSGHSTVRVNVLNTTRRHELQGHIRANVEKGATLHTDALESYTGLHGKDFTHLVVDHAEQYVNGLIHTNGLENFWALLKRGLNGTYIAVEPFHLFRYLDEQAFRFNHRKHMTDADRFSEVVRGIVGRRLTYQDLIGALSAGVAPA